MVLNLFLIQCRFRKKIDEIYTTNLRGVPFDCAPSSSTPRILSHRRPKKYFFVIFRKTAKKGMKIADLDPFFCMWSRKWSPCLIQFVVTAVWLYMLSLITVGQFLEAANPGVSKSSRPYAQIWFSLPNKWSSYTKQFEHGIGMKKKLETDLYLEHTHLLLTSLVSGYFYK